MSNKNKNAKAATPEVVLTFREQLKATILVATSNLAYTWDKEKAEAWTPENFSVTQQELTALMLYFVKDKLHLETNANVDDFIDSLLVADPLDDDDFNNETSELDDSILNDLLPDEEIEPSFTDWRDYFTFKYRSLKASNLVAKSFTEPADILDSGDLLEEVSTTLQQQRRKGNK